MCTGAEIVHPYLDEIIRRIVSVAQPDRVILFGSVGRGRADQIATWTSSW